MTRLVVLPARWAEQIAGRGGPWGMLDLRFSNPDRSAIVSGFNARGQGHTRDKRVSPKTLKLEDLPEKQDVAAYYRVDPALHGVHLQAARQNGVLPVDVFRTLVLEGFREPGNVGWIVVTHVPEADPEFQWKAWLLAGGRAEPIELSLFDPNADVLDPLADHWPLDALHEKVVVVVGVGSIGGAACEALIKAGIRDLVLVDMDHLAAHNIARHVLDQRYIGKLKVQAMSEHLSSLDAATRVAPLPLDVTYHADLLRPIVRDANAVLVSSDGVTSRRVANHLACWAGVPAVFACVLENGAYGELVRYRPRRTGCLWCLREAMRQDGQVDLEASLDRRYGTGSRHLPMTAVGSDLHFVGQSAAKLTVGTLLEKAGFPDQRTPGDHCVMALRPRPDLMAPFDLHEAGEVRWRNTAEPNPECPSCARAYA